MSDWHLQENGLGAVTWPWPEGGHGMPGAPHIWLRVLETTDVHGHLLAYDYAKDINVDTYGLSRVAGHIARLRQEAHNTLLFDNGDFLQGSALTDIGIMPKYGWQAEHPVIAAMNHLKYDGATLGNHEFNFGFDRLMTAIQQAEFPIVCANALTGQNRSAPIQNQTLLPPFQILKRTTVDSAGQTQTIHVGIIGLVPPQVTQWDHDHLDGQLHTVDMVESAKTLVPIMKSAGADVIVALAHTGIGNAEMQSGKENAGLSLASVPGIDAILLGHTHEVFPDASRSTEDSSVDFANGTLAGVPSVMAGFRGSHLGIIDLRIEHGSQGWHVTSHHVEARPMSSPARAPELHLPSVVIKAHHATTRLTSQPIGKLNTPIHSYLSQFRPDAGQTLILRSMCEALKRQLKEEHAKLHVLATCAPFKTGGRGGAHYFYSIPAGTVTLRSIADLYSFPNTLSGVRVSGWQLREWLECAASCYHTILPGQKKQPLWKPSFPGHMLDTVSGLTYTVDLSQPPRYDRDRRRINASTHRVFDIKFKDTPIASDDVFALAINNYSASAIRQMEGLTDICSIYKSNTFIRDIVTQYVRENGFEQSKLTPDTWSFKPTENASVLLETGAGVLSFTNDLAVLNATVTGSSNLGFVSLEIPVTGHTAMLSQDSAGEMRA